jgi:hypothetical protein
MDEEIIKALERYNIEYINYYPFTKKVAVIWNGIKKYIHLNKLTKLLDEMETKKCPTPKTPKKNVPIKQPKKHVPVEDQQKSMTTVPIFVEIFV